MSQKPTSAYTQTEEEFVRDPMQRSCAVLSRVFQHISLPAEVEIAVLALFVLEYPNVTDEEMRSRYQHAHKPGKQAQMRHLAEEFLPIFWPDKPPEEAEE